MILGLLLLLVPIPPLGGFLLLALDPYKLDRRAVLALAIAAGCAPLVLFLPFAVAHFTGLIGDRVAPIFTLSVGNYDVDLAMGLTPMSVVAALTVSAVAACVMIYAVDYMSHAMVPDLRRFYALMNLFEAGMLSMVLAADSIVFFLGWELMGLCSFFLISYNMTSPRAFAAGQKAFIITRIADAALLAALLLLFLEAGTVRLDALIPAGVAAENPRGALIAVLLLVGALGKSAQFPFHTWLPTAMAGPTPVSALLHSATMVAAGAVLLARFSPIIAVHPGPAAATAIAGTVTAAFGALCAIAQTDVKRLLAYSSISQIGYMVLAVGIGAPAVAMAHFVVHAIFKSLLFMAAGVMSQTGGGDTAIRSLRGARQSAPIAFWSYAAGAASLAGLPLVTAGWWSKEGILSAAFESGPFGQAVWLVALAGAAMTGVYAFRPVLAAWRPLPPERAQTLRETVFTAVPLSLLGVLSLVGGVLVAPLTAFMGGHPAHPPHWVELAGAAAALLGLAGAVAVTYVPALIKRVARARRLRAGMQMDARYYATFVRPYRRLVRRLSGRDGRWADARLRADDGAVGDPVGMATVALGLWLRRVLLTPFTPDRLDIAWMRTAAGVDGVARKARRLQTGRVRDYALGLAIGLVALLLLAWGTTWR